MRSMTPPDAEHFLDIDGKDIRLSTPGRIPQVYNWDGSPHVDQPWELKKFVRTTFTRGPRHDDLELSREEEFIEYCQKEGRKICEEDCKAGRRMVCKEIPGFVRAYKDWELRQGPFIPATYANPAFYKFAEEVKT